MKNIKDYLHLYLGCEVESNITWSSELIPIRKADPEDITLVYDALERQEKLPNDYNGKYCKPVLRHLSSMTDEESLECGKGVLDFYPTKKGNEKNGGLWSSTTYHPSQILWLLSNHFDLFGLIEDGLAIDATKLNTGSIA
jgi:hypothetical protein